MREEDRAGIGLTIIVHLVVVIALLLWGIVREIALETSFVLDFSRQEEIEQEQKREQERIEKEEEQEKFDQAISRKLDEMLKNADNANQIRNVAVNSQLRDDRHTAEQSKELMREAERLQNELKAGYKSDIDSEEDEIAPADRNQNQEQAQNYSGPSVLSWTLTDRKAYKLPVPAYKCYGAGMVVVMISVDQQGKVVAVKINDSLSSSDNCLRESAMDAARRSRFNRDLNSPTRQAGEIVYSFIAQ